MRFVNLGVSGSLRITPKGKNIGAYKGAAFDVVVWVSSTYKKEGENWNCLMTQESTVVC